MNESGKSNGMGKYVGPLLLLIGLIALVASYYMVNQKYNDKIDEINGELSGLRTRRDALRELNANKKNIEEKTSIAGELCDRILAKFDGGISYKGTIMDLYNLENSVNKEVNGTMKMPSLTFMSSDVPYEFGAVASSNPAGGVGGYDPSYTTKVMQYSFQTTGSYEELKELLKEINEFGGKRKVLSSLSISYDSTTQLLNTSMTISEYVVEGGERAETMADIPKYEKEKVNVFYDDGVLNNNAQNPQ